MGGPAAQDENFWQVLVRPTGSAAWRLATPAGVADNGGLVVTSTGAGALLAGFRPSQDLTFSPLAATTDAGTRWSGAGPVSPGLSDVPGALAAGPDGRLLALTDDGGVRLGGAGVGGSGLGGAGVGGAGVGGAGQGGAGQGGAGVGARWSVLTSAARLAATPAGRACGLTAVTAAAFAPDGTPLLGGACARSGAAGVFALRDGTWQAVGPDLPGWSGQPGSADTSGAAGNGAAGNGTARNGTARNGTAGNGTAGTSPPAAARSGQGSRVLGLGRWAGGVMALLAVGGGTVAGGTGGSSGGAGVVAAWWSGGRWTLSPVLRTGATVRSAALWAGGSAGLVLAGRRGVTISGPGSAWTALPRLPAGTATLAEGPGGHAEALAAAGGRLVVWLADRAGSGTAGSGTAGSGTGGSSTGGSGTAGWSQAQVIRVPVPYGTSG